MKTSGKASFNTKMAWLGVGMAAGAAGVWALKHRQVEKRAAWGRQAKGRGTYRALVTGASSGIGAAYARRLAEEGYNLVLVARRVERLEALADEFRQRFGVEVEVLPADLSTEAGITLVEQRLAERGEVDFLVNNAGYDEFGAFAEIPIEKIMGLINCLELASVRLCRAALPGMLERRHGSIVNVSSVGAFVAKPRDATYVGSKAFVNLFSESLAAELVGAGVRVQTLCPGFTHTEFHDAPQYEQYHIKERVPGWLWMEPEEVVEASLQALGTDRRVCVPGWKNQVITIAGRSGLSGMLIGILRSFFPAQHRLQPGDRLGLQGLALLACPGCHGELVQQAETGTLVCTACGREYPVLDGIPQFIRYEELDRNNRRFATLYDWFSYVYQPFSKIALAFLGGEAKVRGELLDRLDPRGGRVLEVSIGPGVNLPYLVENPAVGEIYGLDISMGQLKRCQGYAQRHGYPVELYLGNAEALPFQDESFESVFHIGGINFFSDKTKAIAEMIRVAKPGAKILIADETERGAHGYEISLPGFKGSFEGKRPPVVPPVELVPPEMEEIRLDEGVWKGWFYCIEFRKPKICDQSHL